MVQPEVKTHHRKLNNALQAIKVMLANKKHSLEKSDWHQLVDKTKHSIITNPDQYIDIELPPPETLKVVVDRIFQQFLNDQNIR